MVNYRYEAGHEKKGGRERERERVAMKGEKVNLGRKKVKQETSY